MINAEKIFSLPKLSKDDTFTFGCNRCGNCCRDREDTRCPLAAGIVCSPYLVKRTTLCRTITMRGI